MIIAFINRINLYTLEIVALLSFSNFYQVAGASIKETLQLILRKIHKMRFFPWLSVFLLHRWKYKLSENNTILKLKITVLSQKLIIFGCLVNKYCCLLLSLSWHMRRKHYQLGLRREKRTAWRPRRKRLKGARDIILIHNIYLGDQYMSGGRKKKN